MGFTGFYWVLLGFTGFRIELKCTLVFSRVPSPNRRLASGGRPFEGRTKGNRETESDLPSSWFRVCGGSTWTPPCRPCRHAPPPTDNRRDSKFSILIEKKNDQSFVINFIVISSNWSCYVSSWISLRNRSQRPQRNSHFRPIFDLVITSFTGFYWVLLGFTGFEWVLLGLSGFYLGLRAFYRIWLVLSGFDCFLLGFTGFYRVLPGFTGFEWVLVGFTSFERVLLGLLVLYWVLLGFTGSEWVFLGFIVFCWV